jgi:hypothetical protein
VALLRDIVHHREMLEIILDTPDARLTVEEIASLLFAIATLKRVYRLVIDMAAHPRLHSVRQAGPSVGERLEACIAVQKVYDEGWFIEKQRDLVREIKEALLCEPPPRD